MTSPDHTAMTVFECSRTGGYAKYPGVRSRDWCPFCGHGTDDGDHEHTVHIL